MAGVLTAGCGRPETFRTERPYDAPEPTEPAIASTFDGFVEQHGRRILSLLQGILQNRADADDACQETLHALWLAHRRLEPGRDPWPFIRRTAVRKAIDLRRARPVAVQLPPEGPAGSAPTAGDDGIRLELAALAPSWRTAIVLFFWEGLTVREVATEMGATEGAVKTWLFRGRERLRAQLAVRKEAP